ncbi:conserved hypothetical protein [Gammaproteobacteria bacterium]
MVVVLMILGIVATVVSVKLSRSSTIGLNSQAEMLASDIRYTQSLAMTNGERYRLVKTSSSRYQIQNSAGVAIVVPSGMPSDSFTVELGDKIFFGDFTKQLPNNFIAFNSKGVPYIDASTPLKKIATIELVTNGNKAAVLISPETGFVTVSLST